MYHRKTSYETFSLTTWFLMFKLQIHLPGNHQELQTIRKLMCYLVKSNTSQYHGHLFGRNCENVLKSTPITFCYYCLDTPSINRNQYWKKWSHLSTKWMNWDIYIAHIILLITCFWNLTCLIDFSFQSFWVFALIYVAWSFLSV